MNGVASSPPLSPRSMLALVAAVLLAAGAFGASGAVPSRKTTVRTRSSPHAGKASRSPSHPAPLPTVAGPALVWTGDQDGHLEPCGCAKPQLGGMLRRAGFLRSLKAPTLRLDNGDLTAARGRQDELKAETSIQLLNQLDYAAINLGESEFRLGLPYLRYLASSFKGALLCANARDAAGQPLFREYTVRELKVGSQPIKVAVAGLLSEQFGPEAEALNPGLKIASASETLDRLQPSLKAYDLVVLLFHGEPEEARQLVAGQNWISAVIAAHAPEDQPRDLAKPGAPRLLTVGRDGKYVGVAEIGPPPAGGGRAALRSVRGIELGPEIPDDPDTRPVEKLYLQRVADEGLLDKLPRLSIPEGDRFAGTAVCKSCHSGPHKTWVGSVHSRAWETLVHVGHERDPDCVGCHVVGLEYRGGFVSAKATPHLEDVGCESCHRAAGRHAASPTVVRPPKAGASACANCHVPEHSPGFIFATYWAKIRH